MSTDLSDSISRIQSLSLESAHHGIPFLDELFSRHPELEMLTPVHYERQSIARRIFRTGNRRHNVGLFASRLNQAMVPFESNLEKHACALFESRSEILDYRSQPMAIQLFFLGQFREVYPDFILTTARRSVLVDVKFSEQARRSKFLARAEALQHYARQRGMGYTVLTESEIRVPRMESAAWLISLARGIPSPQLTEQVWAWLKTMADQTLSEVITKTQMYPQVQCTLAALILDGHLEFDWDRDLKPQPLRLQVAST